MKNKIKNRHTQAIGIILFITLLANENLLIKMKKRHKKRRFSRLFLFKRACLRQNGQDLQEAFLTYFLPYRQQDSQEPQADQSVFQKVN